VIDCDLWNRRICEVVLGMVLFAVISEPALPASWVFCDSDPADMNVDLRVLSFKYQRAVFILSGHLVTRLMQLFFFRVLKAPGGGSSNIFGHYQEDEERNASQRRQDENRRIAAMNAQVMT